MDVQGQYTNQTRKWYNDQSDLRLIGDDIYFQGEKVATLVATPYTTIQFNFLSKLGLTSN